MLRFFQLHLVGQLGGISGGGCRQVNKWMGRDRHGNKQIGRLADGWADGQARTHPRTTHKGGGTSTGTSTGTAQNIYAKKTTELQNKKRRKIEKPRL